MKVITRFAPSPTGDLHIGGLRTALFNFLYAKHNGGSFLLRIEDTDKNRSDKKFLASILEGLKWIGINYNDIVYQSSKEERHRQIAQELLEKSLAYKDGGAIRLKIPETDDLSFNDLVLGEITIKKKQIEDVVILRSDGTPTYMLAVVVDDHDMGITHVIRGADHTMNTFKQKIIYESLGWQVPEFAHIPLIHNQGGGKLSKRDGAANAMEFKDIGILPESLFNYLLRLGWSHKDKEIFSFKEAVELFNLKSIGKSPACFDVTKLHSLNAYYLKNLPNNEILNRIKPILEKKYNFIEDQSSMIEQGINIFKTRVDNLFQLVDKLEFYFKDVPQENMSLINKDILLDIKNLLLQNNWQTKEELNSIIKEYAKTKNTKEIYTTLRLAITGQNSPISIIEIMYSLGKSLIINKINHAIT